MDDAGGAGLPASSASVAAEGSGRRTAEAAASEGTRRKPRRETAEADTLRRVEAAVAARGLAPRRERGEERRGLKEAAVLWDGAWDSIARGRLGALLARSLEQAEFQIAEPAVVMGVDKLRIRSER